MTTVSLSLSMMAFATDPSGADAAFDLVGVPELLGGVIAASSSGLVYEELMLPLIEIAEERNLRIEGERRDYRIAS